MDVRSDAPGAHGVTRPTAIAVTRKRSLGVLVTVEVNHKTFGCGFAIEPLEDTMQSHTRPGGTNGQPIALVIRAGLGADLVPRDGRRGVGGSQTGGLRYSHGQQTGQQEQGCEMTCVCARYQLSGKDLTMFS